jgi:hypothetical protein
MYTLWDTFSTLFQELFQAGKTLCLFLSDLVPHRCTIHYPLKRIFTSFLLVIGVTVVIMVVVAAAAGDGDGGGGVAEEWSLQYVMEHP